MSQVKPDCYCLGGNRAHYSEAKYQSLQRTYEQARDEAKHLYGKRHPRTMGGAEIEAFLTNLAAVGKVSASTQNQAKSAQRTSSGAGRLFARSRWSDELGQRRAP